jgi:hypothetical protein
MGIVSPMMIRAKIGDSKTNHVLEDMRLTKTDGTVQGQ